MGYFTELAPEVLEMCDFNLQEFFEDTSVEEFMLVEPPTPAALRKMAELNQSNLDFWGKLQQCVSFQIIPEEQPWFKMEDGSCRTSASC